MILKLCLVFCVFNLKWLKIDADLYDDQPKILVHDGNLVFQSAESKNISIQLKGKSKFLINGIDFLDTEHGSANVTIAGQSASTESITTLRNQLNKVKNLIKGANGIIERLERLESSTNDGPRTNSSRGPPGGGGRGPPDRVRINQLNRRVASLEQRLGNMTEKLMTDNCRSFPCQNGGTCFNMFDSFRCECPVNWEGPTCGQDTNECARFAGTDLGCQNGATCFNSPGSYECVCATGWKGLHCNRHTVDCLSQPQSEICGQGVCVQAKNKDFSYTCICNQGWTTSNTSNTPACTVDVNECESATKHCSQEPLVMCVNTPGSFVCGPCPPGYSGNGYHCSDNNECDINNGGCSISPIVRCVNTRGSYRCGRCPTGYNGDGRTCTPSSETATTSFECTDRSMCHDNARCVQYSNSEPVCICRSGYAGNGVGVNGCTAVAFDPCTTLNCLNGGTCKANGTIATCQCPVETVLPNCERTIDSCTPNPCQNNGTCARIGSTRRYKCTCPKEFAGINCQSQTRSCGGVRNDESGIISYPDSSSAYYHNSKCAWLIKTNHTKVLNITFTKFNIEPSNDCNFDWLQIHDGRSSAAYTIGRFCGNTLPKGGNIISSHNQIYLWFRSDNTNAHEGFELSWESIDPVCGGEINVESHGTIASPGSPGFYPPNRDCEWFITAPPNKRIQFLFYTLMIESHETCEYDYVEIHSGLGIETPRLGKYCNTSHPEPVMTPSHTATVHFHSDADNSDQGFQIAFNVVEGIPGCGGMYTAAKGHIISPNTIDGKYQHNLVCDYIIAMPENTRVSIEFTRFALEESVSCKFDVVEVYEGRTADELKLLGRYCGTQMPPKIVSQKNVMMVKFVSDWSTNEEGFVFSYKLVCGGIYSANNGVISSPNYPVPYEADRECEYDIIAPLGSVIELTVLDLDIEGHSNCEFDNLEIFDGLELENSTSVGKYCGTEMPDTFVSNFNHLRVKFNSDLSIHGRGFKANYTFSDVECGGIVRDSNIVIKPPMDTEGDGVYKSNSECKWLVVAPPGFIIQLNFLSFELEHDTECKYDYVRIFYNGTGKGEQVGPYCGVKVPAMITTTDNIATIEFKSDSSTAKDGFAISLSFIDGTKLCGANYFNSYGIIKSPGTPEYLPNKNCEWIITVGDGQQIELNFKYFELEFNGVCKFDGLEIRNGGNSYSPLIGQFCGDTMPDTIKSFSNQLYLKFYSDSSRNGKGFEIEWDGTATGCGGILTSPRGSITSPGYPKAYGNNAQCEWRISVNEGSSIEIIFTDLDLETQSICAYDYLEIFDGTDSSASSFGKFCSSENHPMHLETSGNHAYIRMNTDDSHQGRGFSLKYSINCNRTIFADSGVIESPNFPNDYPNNLNCSWTVFVNQGNKINMEFSHFYFENAMQYHNETGAHVCNFDYLEITEINASKEPVNSKGKFCNVAPEPFNTTTERLVLNFFSDVSASATGFRAEWQIQGCGGRLTKKEGVLTSPDYPQHYPSNVDCEWTIELDYGHNIEIIVHDMDLEREANCSFDGFQVAHDAKFEHIVTKICHTITEPITITGQGHKLYVKFYSDSSDGGKGFSATYKAIPTASGCGGLLTAPTGAIMSPNYPKNYGKDLVCEWLIRTSISHSLIFQLTDFDMEASENCTKDSFAIYDTIFNKLLWEGCGSSLPNQTTFKSERNELTIRMKSDKDTEAKGFKGSFVTNCGAHIITNDMGEVHYRRLIDSHENCTWVFKSEDPLKHITIAFTYIHTYKFVDFGCESELRILDGDTIDAPLKLTVCGAKVPPAIVSNGNALTVVLTLADTFPSEFSLRYSVLDNACGGTFNTVHGEFSSPGYPNSSPLNIQCEWVIEASQGNLLQLSFKAMDISLSYNCNDNYLEVRKNHNGGELVGTYCGNEVPDLLDATDKYWIKYRTDTLSPNFGFLAEYRYLSHTDLQGKMGVIESPTYPRLLINMAEQTYRIMVKHGAVIRMEFPQFLMVVDGDECESYIRIYNGYDDSAPSLTSDLCLPSPEPVVSDTNVVYIEFHQSSFRGVRFQMQWKEIDKSTLINNTIESECGKVISLNNETIVTNITSPGYPYGYGPNMNCSWIISSGVPSYHPVVIFTDVNFEESDNCVTDYVSISSDRDDGSWKHLDKICSIDLRNPRSFSGTPNLKVDFISDYHMNETGFIAMTLLECGGIMTESEGIIEHNVQNTFLRPRSNNRLIQDCYWNITVRSGRTIQFEFLSMNLRNISGECLVLVSIRNGIDESSPYLGDGRFCGNEKPIDIPQTSSNKAFVKFSSKQLVMGDFSLRYYEVRKECGGEIKLRSNYKSTVIHSPNYPSVSDAHVECFWTIMAPVGERIRIDFIERFDLTTTKDCTKEYVELRDGSTSRAQMIGVFCDKRPTTQLSKSNVLRVKYFTDTDDPKNGFKVNISIATCGGMQRAGMGYVMSPGYPGAGAYPSNATCEYRISGPPNTLFNITFSELNLPATSELNFCDLTKDYVKIQSIIPDLNSTGTESLLDIGTYCDNDPPPSFLSDTNEILVTFKTFQRNSNLRGFKLFYNSTKIECGGTVSADSGVITSPGYPSQNLNKVFCEWKITVPKGRRVKAEFVDVDFIATGNQYLQRVGIYSDFRYSSRLIFVNRDINPGIVYSSDNTMMVALWIRMSSSNKGFKLKFSSDEVTICAGDLNQNESTIIPPNTINNTAFTCDYIRTLDPLDTESLIKGTIAFYFRDVQVGKKTTSNCRYSASVVNVLRVSGEDDNQKYLDRICGNSTPTVVVLSPFPDVKLEVRQSPFSGPVNFTLNYKTHPCGGMIKSGSLNTFKNEVLDVTNYGVLDCAWFVEYGEGFNILFNFKKLTMNLPCSKEYIKIYNGPTQMSPLIGKYCGNILPVTTIYSQTNKIFIEYHTDNYNIAAEANSKNSSYEFATDISAFGCGGILNRYSHEIKSPIYGQQYPNQLECIWEIRGDPGYHIGLTFSGRYFIEDSKNCSKDYLEIYDYKESNWTLLGRHCGRSMPPIYNATAEKMKVIFRSDESTVGDGFSAEWQQNCGGILTVDENKKILSSPGYPKSYGNSLVCNYTFVATDPNKFINLNFMDFNVEAIGSRCMYDNITIYKLNDWMIPPTYEKHGVYCGSKSPEKLQFKQKASIVFRSDRWIEKKGFQLEYNVDQCGGDIKESTMISTITDESSAGDVGSHNCVWNITAPSDKKIVIRFESFSVEHSDYCVFDYVEIFNGHSLDEEQRLAKLCGNLTNSLRPIVIQNNLAVIQYKTDLSNNMPGFSAAIMFKKKCDMEIVLTLENPDFLLDKTSDDLNEDQRECIYKVVAPPMNTIKMELLEMHLSLCAPERNQSGCSCDYLEVLDGNGPFSNPIGKYCGYSLPIPITSTNAAMYLRYVTDATLSSTGFKVRFTAVASVCGFESHRTITEDTEFWSPGSDKNPPLYPANARCMWIAEALPTKILEIEFIYFELEEDDNCTKDKLIIEDSTVKDVITEGLGKDLVYRGKNYYSERPNFYTGINGPVSSHIYCGTGKPHQYVSQTNKVKIIFQTNSENQFKGFKMKVSVVKACSRNFTSLQGRVLSSDDMGDCKMTITVPENYTIAIYFFKFFFYEQDCAKSFMKFYDGDFESGALLRTICGYNIPDPIFSTKSRVSIYTKFENTTNNFYSKGNYDMMYVASDQGRGCGGEIYNYGGLFSSPLYPETNTTRQNTDCTWIVSVPQNLKVALRFQVLDMGSNLMCISNYVEFIEETESGVEQSMKRFCGSDDASVIVSSRSKMKVHYVKTVNFDGVGWMLQFMGVHEGSTPQDW